MFAIWNITQVIRLFAEIKKISLIYSEFMDSSSKNKIQSKSKLNWEFDQKLNSQLETKEIYNEKIFMATILNKNFINLILNGLLVYEFAVKNCGVLGGQAMFNKKHTNLNFTTFQEISQN